MARSKPSSDPRGTSTNEGTTETRYQQAMARLAARLQDDDAVLAVMLCGSLAYDRVWHKSDIDLIIVGVDDPKKVEEGGLALVEDDINVHASVMRRESFRRLLESTRRNSFLHSYVAKGRLVFSKDDSLDRLFDGIEEIGERDRKVRTLDLLGFVLPCLDKAQKWLTVKKDYPYATLYVLHAATSLAGIELTLAGKLAGREVLQQALELNPKLFNTIYVDLMASPPSAERVTEALRAIEDYLLQHKQELFGLVLEYLSEVGTLQGVGELEHFFARTHGVQGIVSVCEWLADQSLIVKGGVPRKVSRRSSIQVQELAFGTR